jgi:predicted CXXCH cytochrome family protein
LRSFLGIAGVLLASAILLAAFVASPWEHKKYDRAEYDNRILPPTTVELDASAYAGDKACAGCHPGETAAQSGSGHQHTLWPAARRALARRLNGQRFADPENPGVEWSYQLQGDDLEAVRHGLLKVERMRLQFGIGSGKHGVSFVNVVPGAEGSPDPSGIEHRFSYLVRTAKMEITPGQERDDAKRLQVLEGPFGRELSPVRLKDCLRCHVTLLGEKHGHIDPAAMIPNVSCERCHGPGRDHIEAVRRGETEDLKMPMTLLTEPGYQVEQCGECHRMPSNVPQSSIHPDNPQIVRFQSLGLMQSACFDDGRSTLKCSSCHEVHGRTSRDTLAYESVCLECHQAGGPRQACPISPRKDCVGCHMPRREVPGGFMFTDHWIRTPGRSVDGFPRIWNGADARLEERH